MAISKLQIEMRQSKTYSASSSVVLNSNRHVARLQTRGGYLFGMEPRMNGKCQPRLDGSP